MTNAFGHKQTLGMVSGLMLLAGQVGAAPMLFNPALGTLEQVAQDAVDLNAADGLTFDSFGNLFVALEVVGNGGVSYVDKETGSVLRLISGVSGVDQVDIHPSGALHFTSELTPEQTSDRLYRMDVTYGGGNTPVSATATSITTSTHGINNPEGLVTLNSASAYGGVGDLIIAEDRVNGRLIKVVLSGDNGTTAILVDTGVALDRPEGLAFGDFGGAETPALYVAETNDGNVLRVGSGGGVSVFATGSMVNPDNLEFGPDGYLYVSEDLGVGLSRILRYDRFGNEQVVVSGVSQPAGLAFDPTTGYLYFSEQNEDTIWRVRFAPVPATPLLLLLGIGMLLRRRRRQL